ncbi:MAG: TniQ family protein [Paracoccaceae bacterium]|nr:TniQ family protein [Paracoccaceae bacterium]
MSGLALLVDPSECEPATSWASRLAEKNGCTTVQDFVHDMGVSWARFRIGDQASVASLCDVAGVDSEKLLRSTYRLGRSATSKWVGGEWIAPKLMRFDTLNLCPDCIAGARRNGDGFLQSGAPVWWYIEGMRVCPVHRRTLLCLPAPQRGRCKHDFAGRVRDNAALITSASASGDKLSPGRFEQYIINRLKCGVSSSSWLDKLDLATVVGASEKLGLVTLGLTMRDQTIVDEKVLLNATSRGFDILSVGPKHLCERLRGLQPEHSKGGFYSDFFPFSQCLDRIQHRPTCTPLIETVRDFVVNNYPCSVGEVVLGERVEQRKVHSISSAAKKANVTFLRMRKILSATQKKLALEHLPRPSSNLWVKSADWDAWLHDYGNTVTIKPAARKLGVCPSTFSRLVSNDLIKPFAFAPETAPRYSLSSLDGFVKSISENAIPLMDIPPGMLAIGSVQSSCKTSISNLLQLLLDKRLKTVGRLTDHAGISGICIAKEELLDELEGPPLPGLSSEQLRKHLRINYLTIPWLVSRGLLSTEKVLHPRTRKSVQLFRYDEINRFLAEYETVGRLSYRWTTRSYQLVKELKQQGIEAMAVERNMSVIYRRRDLPDSLL